MPLWQRVSLPGDGFAPARARGLGCCRCLGTAAGPASSCRDGLRLRARCSSWVSPGGDRLRQSLRSLSFQVLDSLLNQSENLSGWPRVVSEDLVKQVHKLKNEMFVMGGKIKGKTLLPVPEHLGSLDGTLESMERWGRERCLAGAGETGAGRRLWVPSLRSEDLGQNGTRH